jgi:hypothetical protein
MNWPYLARKVAGIVLLIVIVGGLLFVSFIQNQGRNTNYGFGPEWDCYYQQKSGPVCMKRVGKTDKSN